jgi:type IV pilus assembly protein PilB
MAIKERKRLGDLLVEEGKITKSQLLDSLLEQKKTGRRLGEILIDNKILSENDMLEILEKQLGIQRVHMDFIEVNKEVIKLIPENLAVKYCVIPINFDENKIMVAMCDPLNMFALEDLKIASGREVEPLLASKEDIKKAISKYYSTQAAKKAADELSKEQNKDNDDDEKDENNIKYAPAVRLVETIINNAIKARASDIHIEPFEKFIKIRYRIDGDLHEVLKSPKDILGALVTRIKILANLNIAEKRLPQDGRILTRVDGREVDLRVSILPTVFGEKIVIRILSRDNMILDKKELGLDAENLKKLNTIVQSPYGIVLVTGPTGSGKSTTLYAVLSELNSSTKNIITVEDPVEYLIEGINQVNVNVKAGLTFASGLRSILRQDPDIIMIGEIRDSETAEIAVRAAITGHLVLSTIHTNDAASAVIRLADMGIEPYLVATSIAGVISQRLVKKICPYCVEKYEANSYEKEVLKIDESKRVYLYRGKGCNYCGNTGYKGRTAVYEIMEITKEHRELIIKSQNSDDIRDLSLHNGMKTLKMSCKEMVLRGITTIDEMIKITNIKE